MLVLMAISDFERGLILISFCCTNPVSVLRNCFMGFLRRTHKIKLLDTIIAATAWVVAYYLK